MKEVEKEKIFLSDAIDTNKERILGLGIRCLNGKLISHIISYFDFDKGIKLVSKYWYKIILGHQNIKRLKT